MKGVAEPALAPDGRSVAFAVTTTDLPAIQRQTNIWRVDADGQNARALTVTDKRDSSPAFSPDGTVLAFLSTRAGDPQVFFLPTGGGEAEKKTDVPGGVGAFRFTPDGKRLVLTAEVWPDCGADAACNRKKDEAMEKGKMKAHVADRLFFRHWDAWEDGKRTHVLVLDLADAKAPLRDLTPGDFDSPAFVGGRRSRLRRLARRQGARVHVQPRRAAGDLDELRPVGRPDRREPRGARGAEEHHRVEPRVRRLAALLPGRPLDRLQDAARARLRVRPVRAGDLRPRLRDEPRRHRGRSTTG